MIRPPGTASSRRFAPSRRTRRLPSLVVLLLMVSAAPVLGQRGGDTLSVFFLGNSYIYFNDLPDILEGISQGLDGPRVTTASHTHGGFTLRRHLEDGHLPGAFGEGGSNAPHWDAVVLQEQSALATTLDTLTGRLGSPEDFQDAVRDLEPIVRGLGATPVLYMTWAKERWPAQIDQLSAAYRGIGEELDLPVAPVGLAWARALDRRPDLALHLADGSHPTPAGSYLAACVIYATLTGTSPVGAPREIWGDPWTGAGLVDPPTGTPTLLVSLTPRDAAFLQEIAWDVVRRPDLR